MKFGVYGPYDCLRRLGSDFCLAMFFIEFFCWRLDFGNCKYKYQGPWLGSDYSFLISNCKLKYFDNKLSNIMNSLSTTAPIRMAALPKHYLQFTVRSYTKQMATTGLRCTGQWSANKCHLQPTTKRYISSTPQTQIKDYFPPPDAPKIKEVETAWVHPVYASPPSCRLMGKRLTPTQLYRRRNA